MCLFIELSVYVIASLPFKCLVSCFKFTAMGCSVNKFNIDLDPVLVWNFILLL